MSHESKGNTFYLDPVKGHMANDGSSESPWSTLQELIDNDLIETQVLASYPYKEGAPLVVKHAGAPVKGGDTLILRNGYHGEVWLRGAYNTDTITIKAEAGHEPTLSRIFLSAASHWRLEGLTVSPETGPEYEKQTLIRVESHGYHGPSAYVDVNDCILYSVQDSNDWSQEDWNTLACSGIQVSGDHMVVENNRLKNVNFGISVSGNEGRVSFNLVENFAGDGLRGLGNDLLFEYNMVKNCYNVNDNHDDGFQSWSINDDPPRERIVLRGNIIINYTDPQQPFRGPLQGIGCFDGPYVDWIVENNLVVVDHYHGISFYGAYNCRIVNNTVVDLNAGKPGSPWIRINPHKDKTPSADCLVRNNIAPTFALSQGAEGDHNHRLQEGERLFVDPEAFDFHLRPRVPVIDAGSPDLAPDIDLDGQTRPQGRGFDIGAYEYVVE